MPKMAKTGDRSQKKTHFGSRISECGLKKEPQKRKVRRENPKEDRS